jgi:thiosulfate/3-mercaptopyruvate sulfurtransferase
VRQDPLPPETVQPLISVPSLALALGAEPPERPVVLDVRWRLGGPPGIESYLAGHIPSAVFVDLDRDLCGPPGRAGRHPLPYAGAFQEVMRRAGVSHGRLVVVYDDADATAAARAWWTLRYFGHHAVRVLDGGYQAWAAAGQPAESGVGGGAEDDSETDGRAGRNGDFTAIPGGMTAVDASDAARLARSGILLDARAAERYRGEVEPVDPVAGHIPGAASAPTAGNVRGDGHFKSPAELRERFAALGVGAGAGTDVGVYCGSGVTAAHEVLALSLIGVPAGLYVGSWSEWVTDPSRPVAVGPGAG